MDLWKDLDKITAFFKKSPVKIIMLDFDGTLTPIVKSPKEAKLSIGTRHLLQKLCQKPNLYLAIVSGRELKDIKKKIGLPNIIYGGNHGLEGEILGEKYSFPIPQKTLAVLKDIREQLNKITNQFEGIFIEDKRLTFSLHYRLADKQQMPKVKLLLQETIKPYVKKGLISVVAGKMVFDIRPKVNWDKGSFAKLVTDQMYTQTKIPPVIIYIADDTTDEDVFRRFNKEITIKVGKDQQSSAKYSLKNTKEVFKFLEWMAMNS
ncbi:trehalose-phosphatase [Candidatus Microgenomates bacterium]|nr:trehalose-phosphatase [Candidatus Microgenomates bacterium]